jgi:hypothetical protein
MAPPSGEEVVEDVLERLWMMWSARALPDGVKPGAALS